MGEPPKKRRKKNKKSKKVKKAVVTSSDLSGKKREMSMDAQHDLIDGVVDKIELKEQEKDADIELYLQNKAERKEKKEQKKKDLREKFLLRRMKKKQKRHSDRKGTSFKKASAKRVSFAL